MAHLRLVTLGLFVVDTYSWLRDQINMLDIGYNRVFRHNGIQWSYRYAYWGIKCIVLSYNLSCSVFPHYTNFDLPNFLGISYQFSNFSRDFSGKFVEVNMDKTNEGVYIINPGVDRNRNWFLGMQYNVALQFMKFLSINLSKDINVWQG